jgi:hypothetical protein
MNIDLTKAWQVFRDGGPISDEELIAMMLEAENALRYLEHRGESFSLATFKTRLDLESLRGFARARGLQVESLERFPMYPDLLREDGTAGVNLFGAHIKGCTDKFAAIHQGEHHDSAGWNQLFEAHMMENTVEAVLSISKQKGTR